jgi:hypothetical protein
MGGHAPLFLLIAAATASRFHLPRPEETKNEQQNASFIPRGLATHGMRRVTARKYTESFILLCANVPLDE